MNPTNQKPNIAILGGGPAAMAAAFELTNNPGWSREYNVTVYQMGWRLGGKCASGRNAVARNRIEEHGLHMWMGFYENAFSMMRQCFTEFREKKLVPDSPFQDWTDAFNGQSFSAMTEKRPQGYRLWGVTFPARGGTPGDAQLFTDSAQPPTAWDYVGSMLRWLADKWRHPLIDALRLVDRILEKFLVPVICALVKAMPSDVARHTRRQHKVLLFLLRKLMASVARKIENDRFEDEFRHLFIFTDFVLAVIIGMIEDDVLTKGFTVLDEYEMSDWLRRHGSTRYSVIMKPVYDASFAYLQGDPSKPNMSAGAALHGLLRLFFSYKGFLFYRMNAGMGDTIFAPLYMVLRNRGVNFEFFHKVTNLGLSEDRKNVDTITFDVQATVRPGPDGNREYDPLVTVKEMPCWPAEPLYEKLEEGEKLKDYNLESAWTQCKVTTKMLRRGEQFHQVVLGISLAALPSICPELIAANPRWDAMVRNIPTVQTQSCQVWFGDNTKDLGLDLDAGSGNQPTVGGYVEPFDICADMTHLLEREEWLPDDGVKQVTYWCNCLQDVDDPPKPPDPSWPPRQQARVLGAAADYFKNSVHVIYPKLVGDGGSVNWHLFVDPKNGEGAARLQSQYYRANIDPTERYVLSPPGAMQYRLKSWESGFDNLYLAGDWTDTILNSGCVEAAVISGRMASRAICGFPVHIYGGSTSPFPEPKLPIGTLTPFRRAQTGGTFSSD